MYNPFDEKSWKLIKGAIQLMTYTFIFMFAAYLVYLAFSTGFKDGRFAGLYNPPQYKTMEPEEKEVVNLRALLEPTDQLVAEGRQLFMTNCASCHGDKGDGKGPKSAGLNPAPRNFGAPPSEWTNGPALLQIFNTVTNGVPGTSMASFSFIGDHERMAIAHFIQTLVPNPPPNPQELIDALPVVEGSEALAAAPRTDSTSSAGDSTAGAANSLAGKTVPVAYAMQVLLDEHISKSEQESRGMDKDLGLSFARNCASCHGAMGQGATYSRKVMPVGVIYTTTNPLVPGVKTSWAKDLNSFSVFLTRPLPGFPEHNFANLQKSEIKEIFNNLLGSSKTIVESAK